MYDLPILEEGNIVILHPHIIGTPTVIFNYWVMKNETLTHMKCTNCFDNFLSYYRVSDKHRDEMINAAESGISRIDKPFDVDYYLKMFYTKYLEEVEEEPYMRILLEEMY